MKKFTIIKLSLLASLIFALPAKVYSMDLTDFSVEEFTADDIQGRQGNSINESSSELPFFNLEEISLMRMNNEPAKLNTNFDTKSDNKDSEDNSLNEIFNQINSVIHHNMYERIKVLKNNGITQPTPKKGNPRAITQEQFSSILNDDNNIAIFKKHAAAIKKLNFGYLPIDTEFTIMLADLIVDSVKKIITDQNIEKFKSKFRKLKLHPASLAMINKYITISTKAERLKEEKKLINDILISFSENILKFEEKILQNKKIERRLKLCLM